LTGRFDEALSYATAIHEGQFRKGTSVPYISHLLAVAAIVLEDGGSEDEVIAALLHDAVEDAGGRNRAEGIRRRFGSRVADIVLECSDADVSPKPPWRGRKEAYIGRVHGMTDEGTRRVSLADKVHNARCILLDYRAQGEQLWARFNPQTKGDDHVWYLESLVEAFRRAKGGPLVDELARIVDQLKALRAR
jgi:(p)ppGpp synthase/HD superfamily hydrolase